MPGGCGWSHPENPSRRVSHETIYQYIYAHPTGDPKKLLVESFLDGATRVALDENELGGPSVKALHRWRQVEFGPVFCKLGVRVTYLIFESQVQSLL